MSLCNQSGSIFGSIILFWIVILKNILGLLFDAFHSDCIRTCCCGDVVGTFFIIDWFLFRWILIEGCHLIDELLHFLNVQCYQPWHFWNLLFQMLVDYWDNLPIFGSGMKQSLHMFYQYLFFCARFWVFHWKFRMPVRCCSRGKEVYWRWIFCCLLLKSLFHCWAGERGQKLV